MWTQRALSISGLIVAALIGALVVIAWRFPAPESFSDWLTPLVALATIAQAVFAFWALEGIRHAREAANHAKAALDLSRDTAERQLRAYVGYFEAKLDMVIDRRWLRIFIIIRNTGATPAYEVDSRLRLHLIPRGEELRLNRFDADGGAHRVLPPTRDYRATVQRTYRIEEINGVFDGTHYLYAEGFVTYIDAFNVRRRTSYLLKYNPIGDYMAISPHGNSAD